MKLQTISQVSKQFRISTRTLRYYEQIGLIQSTMYEGDDPEMRVHKAVDAFVRESNLTAIKPDLRQYGFNSPNPVDETGSHGYEVWVTIPDGFSVPEPLIKKHFEGGLYAAHMIPFGAFFDADKGIFIRC